MSYICPLSTLRAMTTEQLVDHAQGELDPLASTNLETALTEKLAAYTDKSQMPMDEVQGLLIDIQAQLPE
ncbi:hypothetical protein [Moraxella lincolnii]|uniref:Uncharacterized protein n=1 Tax=Lwoffella lincolnii TaxID=90241 RepID=A0A1T0CK62_9GAMM|nr:hypothetical protein [Moraxella lincolnii]OOS22746.1 hypothetical protein B0682_00540 [Moraxella lincolnii]